MQGDVQLFTACALQATGSSIAPATLLATTHPPTYLCTCLPTYLPTYLPT